MSATALERYRPLPEGRGRAHDVLLDRGVTVQEVASQQPERLARQLRLLPRSPWVHVLDAVALEGRVLVVMPPSVAPLDAAQEAGLSAQRCRRLAASLDGALAELAAHGLAPVTVDPAQVGTTADGDALLVPVRGTRPVGLRDCADLLAVLQVRSSAPEQQEPQDPPADPTPRAPVAPLAAPRDSATPRAPAARPAQDRPAPRGRPDGAAALRTMLAPAPAPQPHDDWRESAVRGVRQAASSHQVRVVVIAGAGVLAACAVVVAVV